MASIRDLGEKRTGKKGGPYEVQYRDKMGKLRSRTFRTKEDARLFKSGVETDMHRGEWRDPKLGKVPFGKFAAEWLETTVHLRPSSVYNYNALLRKYVLPVFAKAPIAAIERVHVQKWVAKMQADGASPGTIRNAYRILSKVLTEAEKSRMIVVNPARGIPLPRSEKQEMCFLTPEQISRLADAIEPRFKALILMAGYTGLRFGELCALKVSSLDLLRGSVQVRESISEVAGVAHVVPPKTGERRTVPLPRFLCDVLTAHLAEYPSKDGYVFTSPEGMLLRKNFYARYYKPAVKRAELNPALRFHDLRHSAASIAINLGANVKIVQNMLGHASATMTLDTYSHVFPALADQLTDGLEATYRESEATDKPQIRRIGN